MSQAPLAQSTQQDEAKESLEAQPVTDASKTVAVTTEQAEPQQPVPPKTAVKKVAVKPKGAKKTVAEPAEQKAVTTEAKPVRKRAAKAVESQAEAPKVEKVSKDKKPPQKKPKLVRDSFTIPENDYELFATLKQRALTAGVEVKKSELLRAGLAMLAKLDDAEFIKAVGLVDRIKTGRPKK